MPLLIFWIVFLVEVCILLRHTERKGTAVKSLIHSMEAECIKGIVTNSQLEVMRKRVNSKRSKF